MACLTILNLFVVTPVFGTSYTVTNVNDISDDLTVTGPGAGNLSIGQRQVSTIDNGKTVAITDLTVANAYAPAPNAAAISNYGDLTLTRIMRGA